MTRTRKPAWLRPLARAALLAGAAVSLAGCVVAPYGYGPRWHPYHYYR